MCRLAVDTDHASNADESRDRRLNPFEKRGARRHQIDVQPVVDIERILSRVISIRVSQDGSVTLDAASQKVGR